MSPSMTKNTLFAAALAMASTASAHMIMSNPVPYGSPNNSPLDGSGSDFPCKVGPGGAYVVTSMNEWTVGSDVTLTFVPNSATHSGGSCQVSVTKDKEPTPQSVWKVIHSIEGGCPTADDGNSRNVASFPFTVPSELPEGQMTMAWTWFNKSGNREMYMNCAPIKVSGGSGDGFDSLPDMAVANIAGQGSCATTENFDYTFANPGKYVTKAGKGPYKELCGGAASEGGSTGGSAPSSGSGSAPTPPKEPTSAPAPPKEPASAPAPPKEPASVPEASTPKAPSTGGSSGSSGSSSGGASGGSSCSEEGALMCKGESMFGLCSNGAVVYMPVAAGTKCQNGVIARRSDMHRNHRRSYIHRNQRRSI